MKAICAASMGNAVPGTMYWLTNTFAADHPEWQAMFGDLARVPGFIW